MSMTSDPSAMEHFLRLRFDRFELDEAEARLTQGGRRVAVAPKPLAVLCALARTPGALVTKNALLDGVWGHRFVSDSVLKSAISELRAALHDDPQHPHYIETVSRRGYRFIATVSASAPPTAGATERAATGTAAAQPLGSSMVGRSDALERLRAAWRLAREGRRQIVWIAGEAGVGKTTLIEHFMGKVGESDCAHGQCVEQYGAGEPYLPVLEALTALCRRDAGLVDLIRAVAPTWLLQLPWLSSAAEREALRRELSGASQARMLREMGELIDRYTENRPLLLVSEDLHWSDSATVQLIHYIARRRSSARLLWLASFRLTEIIAADHPLGVVRHELRLHGLSEEIVLDSFSEQEVAEYVSTRIPRLAAQEIFVRALHRRTEGLPLFVADAVNHLAAHGELGSSGSSGSSEPSQLVSMAVPETLTGIIERYIVQLTLEQLALLEAASVCGVEFRLSTVAKVLERDAAPVAEACAKLARRQRWLSDAPLEPQGTVPDAAYVFRHALYREVIYERIGLLVRVELHRKVAAALEGERASGREVRAAELASHFELGHEPMRALRCYAEAAESALLHFSPSETMGLAERGLALIPRAEAGHARATLEITLATLRGAAAIQAVGLTSEETKRAFERALSRLDDVPQHPLRGLFLHGLGLLLCMRGELREAQALAERIEAVAASEDRTALLCTCLVHGLLEHLRGRSRIAREWFEKGLEAAEALNENPSRALFSADPGVILLGLLAIELQRLGFVDQGRARILAAHARARAFREPGPRMAALWLEAQLEVRMGNAERVAAVADELRELVEEHPVPQIKAAQLWFHGWERAQRGDARAGYLVIREGCKQAAQLGIRAWASERLGYAAEAALLAGDCIAARKQLDKAMDCANAIGEREYLPRLLLLDARIAEALGERDRARESIRQAIAEARAQETLWPELVALVALCERTHATADDFAELRRVVNQLTEGLDTPPVERARALLAGAGRRSSPSVPPGVGGPQRNPHFGVR